ncbi:MAG: BACON domain-containing protein [Bacteroidota bacterium]|nr:BACON domain-containing protein [Bacteroidota bacterium]
MKNYKFINRKLKGILVFSLFLASVTFFTACVKSEEEGTPYFKIEDNPTGLSASTKGVSQSYTVRSNRPWKIVAKGDGDWIKAFPAEGEDDGIFKIIVDENTTFDKRSMQFAFVVDGEEQPVLFTVDQDANIPSIVIAGAASGASIVGTGGTCDINITSNVDWTYSLSDSNWLTLQSLSPSKVTFAAGLNTGDSRSAVMTITAKDLPGVTASITITQASGVVILNEDFSWLEHYYLNSGSSPNSYAFYNTTGAKRYDSWTDDEKAHGWTSTNNSFSSNQPLLYAGPGFAKLGKTTYGGDLISPKLNIVGTKNVKVTFKAVPYETATGTKDDNYLNIFVLGAGTPSVTQFVIDNWPVYPTDGTVETYCQNFWKQPEATRTFTITGATSATQIKFLGGDYNLSGVGAGKNRIFLDDIKVEIIP